MRPEDPNNRRDDEVDPRWLELADSISGEKEVDWPALEREVNDDYQQKLLKSLGTLAAIGHLHSTHHGAEPTALPEREAELPRSGAKWGSLELGERLGHGSFGSVWSARDPRLDREVALKLLHPGRALDPQQRDRILEEGRCMARLDHPNVVRILGAEDHDEQVGLWMERVKGRTLGDLVRDNGPFGADEAAMLGEKIARALAAVHGAGVVHRDVKASNVMRADGGRVVLMDFGAFGEIQAPEDTAETGLKAVTGTPFYLAPELLNGADADARSDIYALGVLLHHLVTGSYPVQARSISELKELHAGGARRSLADARPDLPADFVAVVDKALDPDPARRFASAGALAQALASPASSAGTATSAAELPRTNTPAPRRMPWLLGGAAAAILAIFALFQLVGGGAFTVEASLLRYLPSGVEELYSGASLGLQQDLGLRVSPSDDVHLYVVNRDAQGETWVLFPLRGGDLSNPLNGGETHELPGSIDGEDIAWTVTSSGGREEILLVASHEPLPELERLLAAAPSAGDDNPYTQVQPQVLEGLRGIGGVSRRSGDTGQAAGTSGDLMGAVEDLVAGAGESNDGVWMRRIVLENR